MGWDGLKDLLIIQVHMELTSKIFLEDVNA